MKKKVLLLIITITLIIAAAYTGFWFFAKHKVEQSIEQSFNYIKKAPSIKYANYNLDVSCFPFLCVKLSNVNIKSVDNLAKLKNGLLIRTFEEKPFIYKTKNIFQSSINILEENTEYDFTIFNPSNTLTLNYKLSFKNLNILLQKNKIDINLNKVLIEKATDRTAYVVAMDIDNLNLYFNKVVNKNTSNIMVGYNLFNLNIIKQNNKKQNIKHSLLNFLIKDIDNNLLAKLDNQAIKPSQLITNDENINNIIENKTRIQVSDFKLTDENSQIIFKGYVDISKDKTLNAIADSSIKILKEKTVLQTLLDGAGIGKNENNVYVINVRTNADDITINKDIHLNAPKF
jgi:hypothetical protein